MRKQTPFHKPADGLETLRSEQLGGPHASPLAFPTLGYSGPHCHCGAFHSATAQIKPDRGEDEKWKTEETLFVLTFIEAYHRMVSRLIYRPAASPKHRHSAAFYIVSTPAAPFKEEF